jgi:hypothetical protein
MAMYASARGWLQLALTQREAAEHIIERHREGHYSGGWAFPAKPFNWTLYLFYGGDLNEIDLPWLRAQVDELAALPPADDDGDRPVGLFVINDERGGAVQWEIRAGRVEEKPAPFLAWLSE